MNTVGNSFSDKISSPNQMKERLEAGMGRLAKEDICLTFSDGVDSSLLLKTATDTTTHAGRRVYIVTFDSHLHPSYNLEIARHMTGELRRVHEVITVGELEQESIKNNSANRYYLCKCHLFSRLAGLVRTRGTRYTLDGTNENDIYAYRPGIRVLKELGIISLLTEPHITKAQVKALASEYGMSVASRPSTPCMATRLPYGAALDYEVPRRIGEGEACVRTMVPGNVRLRLHGDIVRLELDPEAPEVSMKGRKEIVSRLKKIGFMYVTLDAEGFRSGGMDAGLNRPEVQ